MSCCEPTPSSPQSTSPESTESGQPKPSILFVCVHNAGRSQMAAGFVRAFAGDRVEVRSAGSEPADQLNPVAVEAMAELGIDITAAQPTLLTPEAVQVSDAVVTMGCGDTCPIFPGKRYEDWQLDDPAGQGIEAVRRIRDDIKERVIALLTDLVRANASFSGSAATCGTDSSSGAGSPTDLPVIVIGAGPIGLAAAAHLRERGLTPLVLEAGPTAAAAVQEWGHVGLFSPWRYNIDAAARRLLEPTGWSAPDPDGVPTGLELVDEYLSPLALALGDVVQTNSRVVAVSRDGIDKTRSQGRASTPFVVRVQDADGSERDVLARAVLDASGTWENPNPLGRSGLPATGESQAREHRFITRPLPAVTGAFAEHFAGRHALVVGAGHSAANSLLDLARVAEDNPETRISWAVRGAGVASVFGGEDRDELPARGALGSRLRALVESGVIEVHTSFTIERFEEAGEQLRVIARGADGPVELTVDQVVPATGFRPDLTILSELRLDLDPAVEAPAKLGPLIDPEFHSCGSVEPHGERQLAHPEPGFYIVGMKSYGRAPTFLMATGYEQVRSIVAALAGDREAADAVELSLPQTGVCSAEIGLAAADERARGQAPATGGCETGPSTSCCG